MKLLIDIGNTSEKLSVVDSTFTALQSSDEIDSNVGILHFERRHESWGETFSRLMSAFPFSDVRISSVAEKDDELIAALDALHLPIYWLKSSTPCSVKEVTGIPATYGADRWAADMGALVQDPDHTLLVVDAGTCITYDCISVEGELIGTSISPGVQLRLTAMHEHTAMLPLVQAEAYPELFGHDTPTAMLSAAVNGARFEIEGYIRQLQKEHPDLHVFVTGGNEFSFSPDITCRITHDSLLVFRGLASLV